MSKNKKHTDTAAETEKKESTENAEQAEILDVTDEAAEDSETDTEALAENARLQNELDAAREEIEKEKKEYLFLMSEFENFRRRVMREKAEMMKNAGEKVLAGLLPIVDDMERGLAASAGATDAQALHEGMELVYHKLVKYLESQGVRAIESTGLAFDAELHEAIATIPAPTPEQKGMVIDTTQKGYTINDKVLRHAKVVVGE